MTAAFEAAPEGAGRATWSWRRAPRSMTGHRHNQPIPGLPHQPTRDSYYGMSVLNPPVWEEREIAGYLFLGGLAGGTSILALAADFGGRPVLRNRCRVCASGAVSLSLLALIKDLGRPERFLNMLRVFKPTSPMSVGTWILSAYSPLSYLASASSLTGRAPLVGSAAGAGAGALGGLVASYTAALISDTAVPAWHEGHREMPFLFVSSAAMAAGGFGLVAAPRAENSPAWRFALAGASGELVTSQLLKRRLGMVSEAMESGVAGKRLKLAEKLALGGLVGAAALGRRNRAAAAAAGAALVAGSALTRFGIFAAGMKSAEDPRFTVEPQRERVAARG